MSGDREGPRTPGETDHGGGEVPLAVVQLDYQVTQDLVKMLTDIRFRLLTILPALSGFSVAVVSTQMFAGTSPLVIAGIGLMGFCLTLGLILYDQRNSDLYNACIHRATILEGIMGFARRGDEIVKASPSSDTKRLANAIVAAAGHQPTDDPPPRTVSWPGGPHRQRAVRYRNFFGAGVSHGPALALIYGVLLAAWLFPITKGVLVFAGNALFNLRVFDRPQEHTDLTSIVALIAPVLSAWCFYKALDATEVGGVVHGLYPDAEPQGAAKLRQEKWRDAAKQRAASEVGKRIAKSRAASLLVSTDS